MLTNDASSVVILLRAYLPSLSAEQWTEEASLAVASQLAHLHAVRWDDALIRPELRWLRWRRTLPLAIRRAHAVSPVGVRTDATPQGLMWR